MSQDSISPRNAVVLVIDQISATMLGPYGNTSVETTNFNRLAARSLLFDFAYSHSTALLAAYDSFWQPDSNPGRDSGNLLAAADVGIESVLISDEPLVFGHQAARFDRIIAMDPGEVNQAAVSPAETSLAAFFAQSVASLTEMQSGSFYWLHSQGLGGPWDAPYAYRSQLADSEDPDPPTFVQSPSRWLDPDTVDPDELLGLQQAAAAQVLLLDDFLGVVLDLMDSSPIWQSTLLCVASPRGCGLGEHGLVGAGAQLYNESVHVPLFVCLPASNHPLRSCRSGRFVKVNLISQLVRDWLLESPIHFQERFETFAAVSPNRLTETVLISSNEQDSLQTHAWKLIRSKMGGLQLYAKPDDRSEVNDVSDRCPDIVRKMVVLLDFCLEHGGTSNVPIKLSEELGLGIN